MAVKAIDLTGQRFGRWTVISRDTHAGGKNARWNCVCDCGTESSVYGTGLRNGRSKSCGCLAREIVSEQRKTHGQKQTPEYNVWGQMKARCNNKKHISYRHYGARGIKIDKAWENSFEQFFADMKTRPSPKHTLERRDNDKGYSAANCYWATMDQQARNRRNNHIITIKGKSQTIIEWAEATGLKHTTISKRLKYGWSEYDAVMTPARKRGPNKKNTKDEQPDDKRDRSS